MKIIIAMLVRDEIVLLQDTLKHLEQANLPILILDDGSTDGTVKLLNKLYLANKIRLMTTTKKSFAEKRNYVHEFLIEEKYDWILWVDCDERFDPDVLFSLESTIRNRPDVIAYRFTRCNLPTGKNFPDFQIRLLQLIPQIQWVKKLHEEPHFIDGKGHGVSLHDAPEGWVYTVIKNPIIHLARNRKEQREWW